MKRATPLKQTSRNLVVVRAGDGSLHQGWLNGSERPDFDLIVSYFGDDPDAFRTPDENRVDQKGGYWDGVYKLFGKHPELVDRYEYFLLADDDLEMQAQDINTVFRIAREHRLRVCQPSLTLDSHYSWPETLNQPRFKLRYCLAVEVMAPCLDRELLQRCLPLFADTMSGYAMDSMWARLLEPVNKSAAIIDVVQIRHTREVGKVLAGVGLAAGRDRFDEARQMLHRFGLDEAPVNVCYAAIDRSDRELADPDEIHRIMARHLGANFFRLKKRLRTVFRHIRRLSRQSREFAGVTPLKQLH